MELVTAAENIAHAYRTGLKDNGGVFHWRTKLTDDDVAFIRSQSGLVSQAALAQQFGVSKSAVQKIIAGTNWKK